MKTQYSALSTRYLPLFWLVILVAYILAGTPITPFHGDESTQIFMSRDYVYQFMVRDLALVTYRDPPRVDTEQHLRLLNGTLNKYLMGLAWHVGGFVPENINDQWDWGGDWTYNQQNNHAPSDALLQTARWPSAILLAAGVVLMFALGYGLGGYPVAYLASLYYGLCPPLLLNGHRAMMEGSLTFFSLLTVLTGVWFTRQRSWPATVALGVAAGLALASKHNAVFTVVAVFLACLFLNHRGTEDTERRYFSFFSVSLWLKISVAGFITLVVFYVLNPAWWGDPIIRARQVLDLREELLASQTAALGGYANFLDALAGFGRQVFIASPQYFEVGGWDTYIGDQMARYEASPWRGVSVGGSLVGAAVLLGLLISGFWVLTRRLASPTQRVIGLWALAMLLTTLLLTPIEWQRYYVPAYPAVGLLAALGLTQLWRKIKGINHEDAKFTKEILQ